MKGIPFRITAQTDKGPVDKVLYLTTRRMGTTGETFKKAKRDYHKSQCDAARATQKYAVAEKQVNELDPATDKYQEAAQVCDECLVSIDAGADQALKHAEKIVRLSLQPNYGKADTESIMDELIDADFHAMVSLIETGELPPDFFRFKEARQKSTTTAQSGEAPDKSSTAAASPKRKSKKEKSGSTKQ